MFYCHGNFESNNALNNYLQISLTFYLIWLGNSGNWNPPLARVIDTLKPATYILKEAIRSKIIKLKFENSEDLKRIINRVISVFNYNSEFNCNLFK